MTRQVVCLVLIGQVVCLGAVSLVGAAEPPARDYAWFLRQLVDLDQLAVLEHPEVRCRQFSSYDRASKYDPATDRYIGWEANADAGQYMRIDPETGEALMADIEGPGCIWRIWSANPQGRIRFYLDGATTPTMEFDFNELFGGKVQGFPQPLVWQRRVVLGSDNPAANCYVPIPFAKGCRVTADKAHMQYYHIGYTTYPADTKVKTFTLERTPAEQAEMDLVCRLLSRCGEDPQPVEGLKLVDKEVSIKPGERIVEEVQGPATIRQFFAKLHSTERWARRKVLLQVYFDGETRPSVEAPLGDFFGDAWKGDTYQSLPLGITDELDYSFWRMPFARSARIVITNQGRAAGRLRYKVAWQPGPLPPDAARFHAKWRRDRTSRDFDYPLLESQGRGHLVGVALYPDNIVGGWWGEGDEKVYVDGEKFPSTFGTGSEDYFGDAWGYRYFVMPWYGCPTREAWNETRRQSAYRWHVADRIPFTTSFRMTIENYAAHLPDPIRNDYSSVTYWYQAPGGRDFFESVPVTDRIPQGPIVPGAIDATLAFEASSSLPPGVEIVTEEDLPEQLCNGKGVRIVGPARTRVPLTIPAPQDDRYRIDVIAAQGVKASTFTLLKDGEPTSDRVRLAKGGNALELELTGQPVDGPRCEVILDYFLLRPYRNMIREWYTVGPFANEEYAGFDQVLPPETEPFKLDQSFAAKGGPTAWRKISERNGVHNLQQHFDDNQWVLAYACCDVIAPEDLTTTGYLGSDDGIKLWVNDELTHMSSAKRPLRVDEDTFEVSLRKGRNRLLVKIENGIGGWGFAVRLHDPDDRLQYALPE